MGQYYMAVNTDKEEYLAPHDLDSGAKLCELTSGHNFGEALILLLADGNGEGGGDYDEELNVENGGIIGRWAGDGVVVTGDYADDLKFCPVDLLGPELIKKAKAAGYTDAGVKGEKLNLYGFAQAIFKNITPEVVACLKKGGDK